MRKFSPVEVEIVYFTTDDVITTSGTIQVNDDAADDSKVWSPNWSNNS